MMNNHLPKKRFGQNFLSDVFIIQQIIKLINPHVADHLVEIGPGLGAITLPLLPCVNKIDAIELDRDIIPLLKKKTSDANNLAIHQQDALTLDLTTLSSKEPLRIVGNLPYNISTPLIFHLLAQKQIIKDMHFMLQKEVAERLTASSGTKKFGRLTVMVQYHCTIEPLLHVPASSFTPAPKVESMFIRLIPKTPTLLAQNLERLDEIVKQAFSKRRKTLHNALKGWVSREQLQDLGLDPNLRPEELTVDNFVKISNIL